MSKISKEIKVMQEEKLHRKDETVTNFMGGESFKINPLETMKMVTASSIFGEPSYYRNGGLGTKVVDAYYQKHALVKDTLLGTDYNHKTTTQIMESVIDDALSYDYKGTLDWAVTLRKEFYMRLNPQVIMVRAALHPNRKTFTEENPGEFTRIQQLVMSRADEPASQVAYYLYLNNGKINNMPNILKRTIGKKLGALSKYQAAKYKNHEIGMIDTVRITHANSEVIDELMQTGTIELEEGEKTWENLRSEGKSWKEIFETIEIFHMALLRNLRGVFTEVNDIEFCKRYLDKLKSGVEKGKQFPFRYYTALQMIKQSKCNHQALIIDALEECIDISLKNMPKLKGKTMCLSDNSGSAWGGITSEYGTVTVAEIDNLSSVITGVLSDEGYVGKFGDRLRIYPVSKRNGILHQAEEISKTGLKDVGGSTEGGIWEFFKNAINNKEHWDNIFIYSDQQAGHGGLYGTFKQVREYSNKYGCSTYGWRKDYINVYDLIIEYRKKVNPKVNVFSVQTASYTNTLVPENAYRTSIMYGWTGKEVVYASEINKLWDEIESK